MAATAGALASVTEHEQASGGAQQELSQNSSERQHASNKPSPESTDIFDPHVVPSTTGVGENDDEGGDEFLSLISPRPGQPANNNERRHLVRSTSPHHASLHHRHHHRRYPHHRRRPHKSEPTYSPAAVAELVTSENFHHHIENEEEDGYTTSQSHQSDNTLQRSHHRSPYPTYDPNNQHQPYSRTMSGTKLSTSSGWAGSGANNTGPRQAAKFSATSDSTSVAALGVSSTGFYYLPTSIRAEGYAPSDVELADLPPLGSPLRKPLLSTSSSNSATGKAQRELSGGGGGGPSSPSKLGGSRELLGSAQNVAKNSAENLDSLLNKAKGSDAAQTIPHSTSFAELLNKKRRLSQRAQQQRSTYYQLVPTLEKDETPATPSPTPSAPKSPTTRLRRHASLSAVAEQKQAATQEMLNQQMPMQRKMPAKLRAYHRLLKQHSGHYNMIVSNVPHRRVRLIYDLWNTLVDLKWRDIILLFLLSYFVTWLLFGLLYYLVAIFHGDLDAKNIENTEWNPCVLNLNSFTTAYLFSFESQHTIGYGFRHITDQCAEAIIILCFQSALGAGLQAFMIGLVFTRIQRPTRRAQTLLFSKNVCVCTRDGQLCLLFRIGNMRRSLIIHSRVTAHLVHHRKTLEGELLPLHQHELYVQLDSMASSATAHHHLAWPMTACHIINAESPLYDMDMEALAEARFELIVTLEGVIESTGQALEARMSYLPGEILWGYRFAPLISYRLRTDNYSRGARGKGRVAGQYVVDFDHFNELEEAKQTPTCSAAEFEMAKRTKLGSFSHQTPFVVTSRQSSAGHLSLETSESETNDEGIVPLEDPDVDVQPKLPAVHSNTDLKQYRLDSSLEKAQKEDEMVQICSAISGRRRSSVQFAHSPPHSIAEDDESRTVSPPLFNIGGDDEAVDQQQDLDKEHHKRKNATRRKKSSVMTPPLPPLVESNDAPSFPYSQTVEPSRVPSQRLGRHQPKSTIARPSLQTTMSAPHPLQAEPPKTRAVAAQPTQVTSSIRPLLHLLQSEMSQTALSTSGSSALIASRSSSSATVVAVINIAAADETQPVITSIQELPKRKISALQRPTMSAVEIAANEPNEEDERLLTERAMARRRRLGSLLDNPQYTFELQPDTTGRHRLKTSMSTTTRAQLPTIEQDVESNTQGPKYRKSSFSFHRRQMSNTDDQFYNSKLLARSKLVEAQPHHEHDITNTVSSSGAAAKASAAGLHGGVSGSVVTNNKRSTSRRKLSADNPL